MEFLASYYSDMKMKDTHTGTYYLSANICPGELKTHATNIFSVHFYHNFDIKY